MSATVEEEHFELLQSEVQAYRDLAGCDGGDGHEQSA